MQMIKINTNWCNCIFVFQRRKDANTSIIIFLNKALETVKGIKKSNIKTELAKLSQWQTSDAYEKKFNWIQGHIITWTFAKINWELLISNLVANYNFIPKSLLAKIILLVYNQFWNIHSKHISIQYFSIFSTSNFFQKNGHVFEITMPTGTGYFHEFSSFSKIVIWF